MTEFSIQIDGREVATSEDMTILDAARSGDDSGARHEIETSCRIDLDDPRPHDV